jgi:Ca-activated chloride channel family protein
MTSRLLISLSLLLLAWQKAGAQLAPADDFFNGGAQFYISNNVPAALERVETGLKIYPDDEKLKKLEQLLKQQQQQQNQQQQNQQNQSQQQKQDQQNKSAEQKNQQQNQQQDSQQQKADEQKQNQADQKKDEEQQQAEQKKASDDKAKDGAQEKQPGEPVKPGEMTPEEAKHLLDAQKGDEQLLQMKPQDKPRDPSRPVKDW